MGTPPPERAAGLGARRYAGDEVGLASLGRVAAAVAHDFGHLLSVVQAHVQCIRDTPGLDEQADGHVRTILEAIRRSRELTRQLADLGRNPGPIPPLELDAVIGASASFLRSLAGRHRTIAIALDAAGARVRLDRVHLEQILLNLVRNALDATSGGGTIRVSTCRIVLAGGEYAVLQICDDGVGIDEATRPNIFEPHFTTKGTASGGGLGLAIVQAIAERAAGFVTVETAPGRGAAFAVHLPVARDGVASEGSET